TDIDIERLRIERVRTNSFADAHSFPHRMPASAFRVQPFALGTAPSAAPRKLLREVEAHPFVPQGTLQLRERCEEVFHTQVAGLAKRLETIGAPDVAFGISGGLDSTLSLLVACKTLDALALPRTKIRTFSMPGFGTTARTRKNAWELMAHLG